MQDDDRMQNDEQLDRLNRREMLVSMNAALFATGTGGALRALSASAAGPPTHAAPSVGPLGPQKVREIENTWVTMPDGVKLAARIWLPEGAEQHPVPAIFNYCPYFARLFTRPGDDTRFPYYASHGYACVRVDIRGSGDSQGRPMDEYVLQEQDDGVEIIRWIASQRWCDGCGRHGRQILERIQLIAGRRAPSAGAEGHHHPLLNRRPLRR